jgi:hypothetical protein
MDNNCPTSLAIVENNAKIMEQPRIDQYKQYFSTMNENDRKCLIMFDEGKIRIDKLNNFGGHYDRNSDTYFSNTEHEHVTTYMVKGVYAKWWFIVQIIFYFSTSQIRIENEITKIQTLIVDQIGLIPVVYLSDMASMYKNNIHK